MHVRMQTRQGYCNILIAITHILILYVLNYRYKSATFNMHSLFALLVIMWEFCFILVAKISKIYLECTTIILFILSSNIKISNFALAYKFSKPSQLYFLIIRELHMQNGFKCSFAKSFYGSKRKFFNRTRYCRFSCCARLEF